MGWFIGIACIAALIIIVALGVISIKENAEETAAKEAANRPMTSYGGRKITDTCECCGEHKETRLYLENGKTVREYCKVCADAARADGYVSLQALNVVKPAPDTPKKPDSSFSPPEPPEKPRKRVKIKKGTIIALCVIAAILIAVVTLTVVFRRQISGFVYEKTGKCFYHQLSFKDNHSITYAQRVGDAKYHDITRDFICDRCGKEIIETKKQKHSTDYTYDIIHIKSDEKTHTYNKQSHCPQCGIVCEHENITEEHTEFKSDYIYRKVDGTSHSVRKLISCAFCGVPCGEENYTEEHSDYTYSTGYFRSDSESHLVRKYSYCGKCGESCGYEDTYEKHVFGYVETAKPTCTAQGGSYKECSKCREREWKEIVPARHTYYPLSETERSTRCAHCRKETTDVFALKIRRVIEADYVNDRAYVHYYVKTKNCSSQTVSEVKATIEICNSKGKVIYDDTKVWKPSSFAPGTVAGFDFIPPDFLTDVSTYSVEYEIVK